MLSSRQRAAGGGEAHLHPRLRFTFRFARLGLLRLCAAGTQGQYSDIPTRKNVVRPQSAPWCKPSSDFG
ncbi:MAG: hypothetical protein J6X65_09635 [Bacteroidales bacterium]|nr:hypothetical protein [Bacteroidales bacterium]